MRNRVFGIVLFGAFLFVGCGSGCISEQTKRASVVLEEAAIQFVDRIDQGKLDPDPGRRDAQLVEQLRAQARLATALRDSLGLKRGEVK